MFAILKEGICGLSILLRPMFKSEMPHWLVPLVSEMLHFIQFPLQTFKHVLLRCDQNMHIVAQTCTISHKIAQSGTKKWKFSMINVKITNLWDCKTYRWTIFNTRCVLDDSRSNTFLCLSSPPLFLHHFFTLTFFRVITFTFFLLWEHFEHIIANPGPISSFVPIFNTSLALDDGRSRVFLWRSRVFFSRPGSLFFRRLCTWSVFTKSECQISQHTILMP